MKFLRDFALGICGASGCLFGLSFGTNPDLTAALADTRGWIFSMVLVAGFGQIFLDQLGD